MVLSNRGSLLTWSPDLYQGPVISFLSGQWPLPVSCWPAMLQGKESWEIQISPLLLQAPATLLDTWYHAVLELHLLPLLLRKVLNANKAFLCFTGSLLPQAKHTKCCYFSAWFLKVKHKNEAQVQAGTVHAHATLLNWYCMKKNPAQKWDRIGKIGRPYHVWLCPGG